MLKRVHIKGFKSLVDVEVHLQPLSVLFGANAVGKSNFLDALQFLSEVATNSSLNDAFAFSYRGKPIEWFTMGPEGLVDMIRKERLSFSIEADIQLSDTVVDTVNQRIRDTHGLIYNTEFPWTPKEPVQVQERNLRYSIEIEMLPKSGELRIAKESLVPLNAKNEPIHDRGPFIKREDPESYLLADGQSPIRVDVSPPIFSCLSISPSAVFCPHVTAARLELMSWQFFFFEPREHMRTPTSIKETRYLGPRGEGLAAFLNTLKATDPDEFEGLESAFKMLVPNVDGIEVGVNNLGEVDLYIRQNGMLTHERILSEGTLRLLGMLCLTGTKDAAPALIGFEEPENGVHPHRIQLIAELLKTQANIGRTQYIVTTHSPILPDWVSHKSLFVVIQEDGQTRIDPLSAWGPIWRKKVVNQVLNEDYEGLPVSERLLRGDFDA